MEAFLRNEPLHYTYTAVIIDEMLRLLKSIKPLQRINVPAGMSLILPLLSFLGRIAYEVSYRLGARIVVVGDTHGQFSDLVTALRLGGWPSEKNLYLFNGDLVDRGEHDVEVLSLLSL